MTISYLYRDPRRSNNLSKIRGKRLSGGQGYRYGKKIWTG